MMPSCQGKADNERAFWKDMKWETKKGWVVGRKEFFFTRMKLLR